MKPVILLVGRLPSVVEDIENQLSDLPIEWLGAHDRTEVQRQLEAEPNISSVIIGAGLDDNIRGELIGIIASRRPDICIHLKDRLSGPAGMAPFVRRVVAMEVLDKNSTA